MYTNNFGEVTSRVSEEGSVFQVHHTVCGVEGKCMDVLIWNFGTVIP